MTAITLTAPAPLEQKMPPTAAPRLQFLDGLRGLTALYVVFCHAAEEINLFEGVRFPSWARLLILPLNLGHYAVGIFIVLSGYCLMLPVASSADQQLKGGFRSYILRRARRILPPYYAAMILTLAFMAFIPAARHTDAVFCFMAHDSFRPDVLISHLLILHNLRPEWATQIAYPMWTVATEWQIYFVFGLLLLPVWRRFGSVVTILLASAMGIAITLAIPSTQVACFWFLGLFAFGMAAAARSGKIGLKETRLWGFIAAGCAALLGFLSLFAHLKTIQIQADFIVGGFAAPLILYCAGSVARGASPWPLRFLEAKPAQKLGAFSYSLYLIHAPILSLLHLVTNTLPLSAVSKLLVELTAGSGAATAAGYLLYLGVEKRFSRGPSTTRQTKTH